MTSEENTNLGILGAGQLARMLVQSGKKIPNLNVMVLTEGSQECVRDLDASVGSPSQFSQYDFVTFENEFLDLSPFKKNRGKTRFFPSLEVIELVQDKLKQKRLLDRLQLATAPWRPLEKGEIPAPGNFVLKWARQGYDGKGTFVASNNSDFREFLKKAQDKNIQVYREDFIDYSAEVALVGARNWSGDLIFYPLVQTQQINGICHDVQGGLEFLKALEAEARKMATKIMEELNYVGVLAIEFFARQDQLLVNELAPRVHNSGHWSQHACSLSQFEAHLRAGLDLSLERPLPRDKFFGMWNLVSQKNVDRVYQSSELPQLDSRFQLEWYQKSQIRMGRKMGHINFSSSNQAEFEEMRNFLSSWERKWFESL